MADVVASASLIPLLDLDPDLGDGIERADWEAARRDCKGHVVRVAHGGWQLTPGTTGRFGPIGLVIAEGVLCREIAIRDRHMLELLGSGDVLQPPVSDARLGGPVMLTAVTDLTLVALGKAFISAAARWPVLLANVHRRLEAQRARLAVQGLVGHLPRAEHRVLFVLGHLADRWGKVVPDGVLLPLPLTHDVLGQLSAARRSTVTIAVNMLESEGLIRRPDDGSWLLTPEAARALDAIAQPKRTRHVLGETLVVRQQLTEARSTRAASRGAADLHPASTSAASINSAR